MKELIGVDGGFVRNMQNQSILESDSRKLAKFREEKKTRDDMASLKSRVSFLEEQVRKLMEKR